MQSQKYLQILFKRRYQNYKINKIKEIKQKNKINKLNYLIHNMENHNYKSPMSKVDMDQISIDTK